jgi:hypothetical protein
MYESGRGINGSRSANNQHDGSAVEFAINTFHVQRDLAEPDNVWADRLSAVPASGKVGGCLVERLVWKRHIAPHAARLEELSMHVMDAMGTGAFVEVVDILCAEVKAVTYHLFDLGESTVGDIWLSS